MGKRVACHLAKKSKSLMLRNFLFLLKTSLRMLALAIALFRSLYPRFMTTGENGDKTALKIESFAFFDYSRFMTTS